MQGTIYLFSLQTLCEKEFEDRKISFHKFVAEIEDGHPDNIVVFFLSMVFNCKLQFLGQAKTMWETDSDDDRLAYVIVYAGGHRFLRLDVGMIFAAHTSHANNTKTDV